MARLVSITPALWFASDAEDAAAFYTSIFPNSRVVSVTRSVEAGRDVERGAVLTVEFELDGQPFTALNGGPLFTFSEAISFVVRCASQKDVDYYWERLTAGGDPRAQRCGWLKDRFGLSWQVVPEAVLDMLRDPDRARAQRVMHAVTAMQKLDIATLQRAFDGREG